MANTITSSTWIKAEPHASAEFQVGDSDPGGATDVINRPAKGTQAILRRIIETIFDGGTFDFTSTTTTVYANLGITPQSVSGTPAQHALYRENVPKVWANVTVTPTLSDSFNVASVADAGTGLITVTIDRDFANATYAPVATCLETASVFPTVASLAVGSLQVRTQTDAGVLDDRAFCLQIAGDQ